jgi:hypothetical protein
MFLIKQCCRKRLYEGGSTMMVPQQWEDVAQERVRDWEKEMQHRQLLAQVPPTPAPWRRWMGRVMVWLGTWLLRFGERMARRECAECVSVAG